MAGRLLVHLSEVELRAIVRDEVSALVVEIIGEGPRLLNREGAARYLGITVRQLDRLVGKGLPRLLVADSPRFEPAELVRWLRSREQQAEIRAGSGLRVVEASEAGGGRP